MERGEQRGRVEQARVRDELPQLQETTQRRLPRGQRGRPLQRPEGERGPRGRAVLSEAQTQSLRL